MKIRDNVPPSGTGAAEILDAQSSSATTARQRIRIGSMMTMMELEKVLSKDSKLGECDDQR